MWKLLLAALEVLVAHLSVEQAGIDVNEHEILPSAKPLIGDPDDLMSVRTVDESFSNQRVGRV